MKQNKWFYLILVPVVLTGALAIFSAQRGDLVAGIINLVCFAFTVWCLRTVHTNTADSGIFEAINLRFDHHADRFDTVHKHMVSFNDLANGRLSNLERRYNELEERMGRKDGE